MRVGLAALVAPPTPAGALPPPLTKLDELDLSYTQITDASCAALVAAIDNDLLPALSVLTYLPLSSNVSAVSAVGKAAVDAALIDLENRAMQAHVDQMFGACMAQMLGTDGTDVPHSAPLHRWHRCLFDHYPINY